MKVMKKMMIAALACVALNNAALAAIHHPAPRVQANVARELTKGRNLVARAQQAALKAQAAAAAQVLRAKAERERRQAMALQLAHRQAADHRRHDHHRHDRYRDRRDCCRECCLVCHNRF